MASTISVGIIGAGKIAAKHLEVLAALPEARLAGISSRTRVKAEALASRFGIGLVAEDLEDLLRRARPDALLVLVSASSVHEVGLAALKTGLPCFLEKPAGLSPLQTLQLAEAAQRFAAPNMVGYNRRFYSVFHQGIDLLRRHGALLGVAVEGHERIAAVRAAGKHPKEVLDAWLYANATHTIDLLRFFGGEIAASCSFAARVSEPLGDQFAAAIRFESGVLGTYQAHWQSPAGWRVTLYGEGVAVEFKPLEAGRWTAADGATGVIGPSAEDQRYKPGFHGQMRAFCALARGARLAWPGLDLAGAYRSMQLAESLSENAAPREPQAVR